MGITHKLNRNLLGKLLLAAALFVFAQIARADAGPPSGSTFAPVDIIIKTDEDFSDYRFFLRSSGKTEEIKIESGNPTRISGSERMTSFVSYSELIAIPRNAAATAESESKEGLAKDIENGREVPGAITVFSPSFQRVVSKRQPSATQSEIYLLRRTGQNEIKAEFVEYGPDKSKDLSEGGFFSSRGASAWLGIIIGIMGLAIVLRFYLNHSAKVNL